VSYLKERSKKRGKSSRSKGVQVLLTSRSDTEIKTQFQVNVFGQLAVSRAVLPHVRTCKSGVIADMGSIGGWAGGVGCGFCRASKFAMVAITEALRDEVKHLGITVTIIEPGYFRTNFLGAGAKVTTKKVIDDLKPVMDLLKSTFEMYNGKQPGDPAKGATLIVEALTGTGRCANRILPARLAIESNAVDVIAGISENEKKDLEALEDLSVTTDHDK
jgi:NAD(P)-dependent dehydrogenase (short-subunit alcohol dehydrogenase family)